MQFDSSSAHARLTQGETYSQQQPTISSTTRHVYRYGGTRSKIQHFVYNLHSFSAFSQTIDMDAQAYPPPLTTFVVSFFLLHPNCSARVGQHASSSYLHTALYSKGGRT
ncbi:hypothetical protein GGR58DRAFT_77588 [Xylaria digitata]|nr:hypothetical protein GGR58DRAFT_77588 [Xylaria digitata]